MAPKVPALFREWVRLDRKRKEDGLSLDQYRRWHELKERLNRAFSPGVADERLAMRESVRIPVRLKVAYESAGQLRQSLLTNLSRGGVFVNTPYPPPLGTRVVLRIRLADEGREFEVPGEVVSTNVGNGFHTRELGMGVRFQDPDPEASRLLERLYERALEPG